MPRANHVAHLVLLSAITLVRGVPAQSSRVPAPRAPTFIALSVRDLAATVAWYRNTFDLPAARPLPLPEQMGAGAVIESPELVIEFLALRAAPPRAANGPGDAPALGIFKAGFAVADLEPFLARFRSMGTRVVAGPFTDSVAGKREVIVADPEGNLIHLLAQLRR